MMYVGIDLSSKAKNPSGIFILNTLEQFVLYKDEDIIELLKSLDKSIVSMDAPLSYKSPYRNGEKVLYKLGFKPLPLNIKSMKLLYIRAKKIIENSGKHIFIETFARASEKILGFKYETFKDKFINKHTYDAWICAIVSRLYHIGKVKVLPDKIVIPDI